MRHHSEPITDSPEPGTEEEIYPAMLTVLVNFKRVSKSSNVGRRAEELIEAVREEMGMQSLSPFWP